VLFRSAYKCFANVVFPKPGNPNGMKKTFFIVFL